MHTRIEPTATIHIAEIVPHVKLKCIRVGSECTAARLAAGLD